MGRGYLKALAGLGVPFRAVATRGFRHDPGFPLPAGIDEISLERARRLPRPRIGLGFLHPPRVHRLLGERRVNLFVWESDRVPPAWVEALARGTDLTVVPSTFARDALLASGFPAEKLATAPYGHDPTPPEAAPAAAGAGKDRRRRPFTFLAVLAPHFRKGVTELLRAHRQAFTAADDVLLRLKTTYDPAASRRRFSFEIPSWREALADAGLDEPAAPAVERIVDTRDDGAMAELLADADVAVQPSWGEAFGLAMLEAMAAGLPLVATGWGGHLDYAPAGEDLLPCRLEEGGGALYEPTPGARVAVPRIDALAARMRWHFENPERSRERGEGNRRAVRHLTWENAARELLRLL